MDDQSSEHSASSSKSIPESSSSGAERNIAATALRSDSNRTELAGPQPLQISRSEDYRKLFHLPLEEVLIQDFNCAFQKKILLQGHMYLFERYLCFYSNILGYEKKKVLPLKDIAFVRKAWTAGLFPNAIEITAWGKKYFYASFLSRDEAYRLINNGWSHHSSHAKRILESQVPRPLIIESNEGTKSSNYQDSSLETDSKVSESEDQSKGDDFVDGEEKRIVIRSEEQGNSIEGPSTISRYPNLWNIEEVDPPALPSHFKQLLEEDFPIDVEEFYRLFFSDDAVHFVAKYHKRCGNQELKFTQWSAEPKLGNVRDISFQHPVNLLFGPKSAYCHEMQRYRVFRNNHLVIETTQRFTDIPYGDYFQVEARWDVKRIEKDGGSHCQMNISINVEFSKKTLWKGKIEQGTYDESKDAYTRWVREAFALLEEVGVHGNGKAKTTAVGVAIENVDLPSSLHLDSISVRESSKQSGVLELAEQEALSAAGELKATSYLDQLRSVWEYIALLVGKDQLYKWILVFAGVMIILMQVTILAALLRPTRCGNSSAGYMQQISFTRLQNYAHFIKEEVDLVGIQMQTLNREVSLLKMHLDLLEKLKLNVENMGKSD